MAWRWPFRKREERVGSGDGWALGSGAYLSGGAMVPVHMAESLSAVTACVELYAGSIASLPASLTIDTDAGCVPAPPSASAWRLLARPNAFQSWQAFTSWLVASVLLRGNGLAKIETDARGAVSGLVPVPWNWCLVSVVGGADGPRLTYQVTVRTPESDALGLSGQRLLASDVLHVRARSDAGLIGRSVLSRAAGVVAEGLEISTLAKSNWSRGLRPSGIIVAPHYLTKDQRNQKADWISEYSGAINAGRVPLLEGDWKYSQMSLSSVDAEFLQSRRFSVEEIARLFSVPAPLIQLPERSVPADLSQYSTLLVQQALRPMCDLIEHEMDHAILPAGMHLELDTDGLARGSFSATVSALSALVQAGVITPNNAREALGWPPSSSPGADDLRPGNAPSWPADATGMPSLSPKPGPRPPSGLAEPGTHQNEGKPNGRGNGAAAP